MCNFPAFFAAHNTTISPRPQDSAGARRIGFATQGKDLEAGTSFLQLPNQANPALSSRWHLQQRDVRLDLGDLSQGHDGVVAQTADRQIRFQVQSARQNLRNQRIFPAHINTPLGAVRRPKIKSSTHRYSISTLAHKLLKSNPTVARAYSDECSCAQRLECLAATPRHCLGETPTRDLNWWDR